MSHFLCLCQLSPVTPFLWLLPVQLETRFMTGGALSNVMMCCSGSHCLLLQKQPPCRPDMMWVTPTCEYASPNPDSLVEIHPSLLLLPPGNQNVSVQLVTHNETKQKRGHILHCASLYALRCVPEAIIDRPLPHWALTSAAPSLLCCRVLVSSSPAADWRLTWFVAAGPLVQAVERPADGSHKKRRRRSVYNICEETTLCSNHCFSA